MTLPRDLLVDAKGLHAWYGSSHVLHGIDVQIGARPDGGPARPQRHGQEHADPHPARAT